MILIDGNAVTLQLAQQPAIWSVFLERVQPEVDFVIGVVAAIADENCGAVVVINQAEEFGGDPEFDVARFSDPKQIADSLRIQIRVAV